MVHATSEVKPAAVKVEATVIVVLVEVIQVPEAV